MVMEHYESIAGETYIFDNMCPWYLEYFDKK